MNEIPDHLKSSRSVAENYQIRRKNKERFGNRSNHRNIQISSPSLKINIPYISTRSQNNSEYQAFYLEKKGRNQNQDEPHKPQTIFIKKSFIHGHFISKVNFYEHIYQDLQFPKLRRSHTSPFTNSMEAVPPSE